MKWKTVTGYTKPLEVEVGKTTAYLRRNIEQTIDGEGNDAWSYEECQMSLAEYEKYLEVVSSAESGSIGCIAEVSASIASSASSSSSVSFAHTGLCKSVKLKHRQCDKNRIYIKPCP